MSDVASKRNTLRKLTWGAAVCLPLLLAAAPAMGQVAAGYSEYYIPGSENTVSAVLRSLGPAPTSPNTHVVVSVTAWSPSTTLYVDHWEDGYDFDPANPTTADETYTLTTGAPLVFESANVVIPRTASTTCNTYRNGTLITTGATTCYDGGDRIYVAGGRSRSPARPGSSRRAPPSRRPPGRSTRSSPSSRPTSSPSARTWPSGPSSSSTSCAWRS